MGYTFTIGKARDVRDDPDYGGALWAADECEGPAPHADEWEARPMEGSPVRCPSYSQWHDALNQLPVFRAFWKRLELWAQDQHADVIPVTEYIQYGELDMIEQEAALAPADAAARAFWFTRWSRHALNLYGEAAVFETPGEWVNWEREPEYEYA